MKSIVKLSAAYFLSFFVSITWGQNRSIYTVGSGEFFGVDYLLVVEEQQFSTSEVANLESTLALVKKWPSRHYLGVEEWQLDGLELRFRMKDEYREPYWIGFFVPIRSSHRISVAFLPDGSVIEPTWRTKAPLLRMNEGKLVRVLGEFEKLESKRGGEMLSSILGVEARRTSSELVDLVRFAGVVQSMFDFGRKRYWKLDALSDLEDSFMSGYASTKERLAKDAIDLHSKIVKEIGESGYDPAEESEGRSDNNDTQRR